MTLTRTHTSTAFKTLARIQLKLPDALEVLEREVDIIDGLPSQCIGASPPSGGNPPRIYAADEHCREISPVDGWMCCNPRPCPDHDTPVALTTVEAAALQLRAATNVLARMERKAKKIMDLCADLENELIRALPKPDYALCSMGLGRDGQIEWGDPLCTKLPASDRGGMCDACAKREYRWRKDRNLPPRAEATAA